jgi:hypothetical protein
MFPETVAGGAAVSLIVCGAAISRKTGSATG